MQFTENLRLPILEGTDTLGDLRSQGNGIANRLETVLGTHLDDIEDIPTVKTDVENISLEQKTLQSEVEVLQDLQTKETIVINNEERTVVKHIAKLSATMNGSSSGVPFKGINDDNTHRHVLNRLTGIVNINMTQAFEINSENNVLIKNVITYQNGYQYQSSRNAVPTNPLFLGKLPNQTDITLQLVGEATSLYEQELQNQGGTDVWLPSYPLPYSINQEVIVVIEYYDLAE